MALPIPSLTTTHVAALDAAIRDALSRDSLDALDIVGAGELTAVVSWEGFACKRLPPQSDRARVEAYGALVERYLATLAALEVPILPTRMHYHEHGGRYVAIMVQPRVSKDSLLPTMISRGTEREALAWLEEILGHVDRCVAAGVGIDPQIANWCVVDGRLTLLDVTTPMLRDTAGRDLLDSEVFVGLLPAVLRPFVRRFMVQDILDQNFVHRRILLDLVGNIANDGLAMLTEPFRSAINAHLKADDRPITSAEISAYRRSEQITWWAIRRAFRLEHWWRRRVSHRPADHLLPASAIGR